MCIRDSGNTASNPTLKSRSPARAWIEMEWAFWAFRASFKVALLRERELKCQGYRRLCPEWRQSRSPARAWIEMPSPLSYGDIQSKVALLRERELKFTFLNILITSFKKSLSCESVNWNTLKYILRCGMTIIQSYLFITGKCMANMKFSDVGVLGIHWKKSENGQNYSAGYIHI